jgi:hypothetical protein
VITASNVVVVALPKGSPVSLNISTLTMPYCGASFTFEVLAMSSDNYQIEKASISYSTTSLALMPLTIIPLYANDSSSAAPVEYQLQFSHPGVLKANSNFVITLPTDIGWLASGSSCVLTQGLDAAATCNYNSADKTIRINSGVPSDRPSSAANIIVNLKNLVNPKGRSTYSIKVDVKTATLCKYATGVFSLIIDKISQMTAMTIQPETYFLNSYVKYKFSVTPKTNLIESGEYLLLTVPTTVALSNSITCTKSSSNLISVTCSKVNATAIKVGINVDLNIYATDKQLVFAVSFMKNPPTPGQISGVNMALLTSSNNEFEIHNTSILVYGSHVTPSDMFVSFGSNYRGLLDTVDYTFKANSYLPSGTILQLKFSDKFSLVGNFSIRQSSPSMIIHSTDNSSKILRLAFSNEVNPNTNIKITLNGNNPTVEAISGEDIQLVLYHASATDYIFSTSPLSESKTFICAASCKDCDQVFDLCTLCPADYELKSGNCTIKPVVKNLDLKANEVSVPFIFLGIALIIILVMFIIGCLCKKRNFWANATYSLLRPNFLVALGVYCYLIWKNQDPRWVWYGILAVICIHIILCVICFIKLRKGIFTGKLGSQVSTNRFINAFANSPRRDTEKQKQNFDKMFRVMLYLTPVFQFSLIRWYFSAKKDEKGALWHFDTESFQYIKNILQRFQMIYVFFVILAIIILTSVSLALNIYLFKIEMIGLCIIDLLMYIWAYLELNPLGKRFNKSKDWESGPLSAKEPMIDNSGMPLVDGDMSKIDQEDIENDPKKHSALEKLKSRMAKSPEKGKIGSDGKLVGPLDSSNLNALDQDLVYDSQGNLVDQPLNTLIAMPLRIDKNNSVDGMRESITPDAANEDPMARSKKPKIRKLVVEDGQFVSSSEEEESIDDGATNKETSGKKSKPKSKKNRRGRDLNHPDNGDSGPDNYDDDSLDKSQLQSVDGIAIGINGIKKSTEKGKANANNRPRLKSDKPSQDREVINQPDCTDPDNDSENNTSPRANEDPMELYYINKDGKKNPYKSRKANPDNPEEEFLEDENQPDEYVDRNGSPVSPSHPNAIKKIKQKNVGRTEVVQQGRSKAIKGSDGDHSDGQDDKDSRYSDEPQEYELMEGVMVPKSVKKTEKRVSIAGKKQGLSASHLLRGDEDGETVLSGEGRDPDRRRFRRPDADEDGEYVRADEERMPYGYPNGDPNNKYGIYKAKNGDLGYGANNYIIDEPQYPSEPNITPITGLKNDSKADLKEKIIETKIPKPVELPSSQFVKDEEGVLRPISDDPVLDRPSLGETKPSIDRLLDESTKNFSTATSGSNDSYRFKSQNKPLKDIESNISKQDTPADSLFNRLYNDTNKKLSVILEQNENQEDSRVNFFAEAKRPEVQINPDQPELPGDSQQVLSPFEKAKLAQKEWRKKRKHKGPKAHLEMLDDNGNLVVVPEYEEGGDGDSENFEDKDGFIPGGGQNSDTDLYVPGAGNENSDFNDNDDHTVPAAKKGGATNNMSIKIMEDDINNPDDDFLTKNDKLDLRKDGRLLTVNGQTVEDINSNNLKDSKGVGLNLAKQRTKDLLQGILCDNRGKKFFCKFNSVNELKKGIIRTFDNELVYIKDQDFDEVRCGILKDEHGNIVEINGQRKVDIDRGVLRMQNGEHLVRMKDQDKSQLNRGIVVCPDGSKVFMGRAQKFDDFSKGLIRGMDGTVHRMIDQNLRDFIKGNLVDTALKKNQEAQKEKNRKANQLFEKIKHDPKAFEHAGGFMQAKSGDLDPGTHFGGSPNKTPGQWNDPMRSPEASMQSIHNPELQKSMCYFDKDGNPIKLTKLVNNPKVYDSLGNIILVENDADAVRLYDSDGKVIHPDQIKDAIRLYDGRGRPLCFNNIGFIHKFYDKHGGLVDYKTLERQDVMYDDKNNVVPVDPLEKILRYCNDMGKPYSRDKLDRHQGCLYDDFSVKYSTLDLLRRQRIYDAEGNILNHKTILTSQLLHDKEGNVIGETDNPEHLPLPYFVNSLKKPIDLHDAISQYLYFNKKRNPVTREDVEREMNLQDWKGRKFGVDETTDIIENPNDPRRLYGANGREVKIEYEVRKEMLRDDHRRRIDIDDLRRRGKLFDSEGKPVTGKILSRIKELLNKKDETVRPAFSEAGDADFSDRRTDRSRSIINRPKRQVISPYTNSKHSKKDLESDYGNMDTLQLNLLADESVDIEVNIIEDESGDDMNHEVNINGEELHDVDTRTNEMHIVIDPGQTSSTFGNPIHVNKPLQHDNHHVRFTNSEREPSETSRGSRFQNAALNKISNQ